MEGRLRLVSSSPARDPYVARAITLMRSALEQRWTVHALAKQVGLSRAAFARRFSAATGETPARFLTRERMARARELLYASDAGLAHIAAQVGYDSEFAFNRAFKRMIRVAPGTFRRMAQTGVMFRLAA